MTDFDTAKYYSVNDDEELLTHEHPLDALEDHLDSWYPERIDEPIKVYAFNPIKPSTEWVNRVTDSCVDTFAVSLDEGFGSPDGDDDLMDGSCVSELRARIRDAIQHAVDHHVEAWACEVVASRTYSREEVRSLYEDV